ncbi:phasin family protein [Lacibacterium aquatile]|uniref:Phasin family protein n=1 Tax=Lacibacterium aquatile TaxID=1168082 RepID=A0ABW5DWE7_9PROT
MVNAPGNPFKDFDFSKMDFGKVLSDMKVQVPGIDVDALVQAQRRNIEAVTQANQLAVEGMQAVLRRQTEIMRQTVEETQTALRDAMTQGAPDAKIVKQADLAKVTFEKALANLRELAEIVTKSNQEAADVINKRFSASIDELKALIKTK